MTPSNPGDPPRISLVTASYNAERYIEHTLRSVLPQLAASDEYLLFDGGSTDRTLEIARAYEAGITGLVSEPDEGQYHAINKGFARSTGDIMGWINADDILMPGALATVRDVFSRFPEVDWITGAPCFQNAADQLTKVQQKPAAYPEKYLRNGWYDEFLGGFLQQENMFWRRSLWNRAGPLNPKYQLAADFDLWTRFGAHSALVPVDVPLSAFRELPGVQRSSVGRTDYRSEVAEICSDKRRPPTVWRALSSTGLVGRNMARIALSSRGPVISFDRRAGVWKKVVRRRSISRVTVGTLIDEWMMHRRRTL